MVYLDGETFGNLTPFVTFYLSLATLGNVFFDLFPLTLVPPPFVFPSHNVC